VKDLLEMANHWQAYVGGYVFKVYQIKDYSWLSEETLKKAVCRMDTSLHIGQDGSRPQEHEVIDIGRCIDSDTQGKTNDRVANVQFELMLRMEGLPGHPNRCLVGSADCVDVNPCAKNLYEFKCTKELTSTHLLQVACYAYLLQKVHEHKADVGESVPDNIAARLGARGRSNSNETSARANPFAIPNPSGKFAGDSDSESSDCLMMSIQLPGDDRATQVDEQRSLFDDLSLSQPVKRQRFSGGDDVDLDAGSAQKEQELNACADDPFQAKDDKKWSYYLYNILTDELKLVVCENLDKLLAIILEAKFGRRPAHTDEKFLCDNEAIKALYYA